MNPIFQIIIILAVVFVICKILTYPLSAGYHIKESDGTYTPAKTSLLKALIKN